MNAIAADHRLWPGKARPDERAVHRWHPATFHCLDVAACARALLDANPAWLKRLALGCDSSPAALRTLFVRLVALHDIGKLSEKFCTDVNLPVPASTAGNNRSSRRHWRLSFHLLNDSLDDCVAALIGVRRGRSRRALYAAVAGHHGVPPTLDPPNNEDLVGVAAAERFVAELGELVPGAEPVELDPATARRLSWSLAGLTVAADWIGSRQEWFPYTPPTVPTREYWSRAQDRAARAVRAAGISGSGLAPRADCETLFDITSPRPMQRVVAELPLSDAPTLVVMEDTTGSGKTEAALLLAHRMMRRGLGEGVYVALPTTATASAMYERLGRSYRRLFADDAEPSIALAHGRRWHDDRFRDAVAFAGRSSRGGSGGEGSHDGQAPDERPVEASCAEWVADDRRKAFLGEVGVGTIDQALLAVLPVKFSALRLFGLGQRILIVDEAHACDPYMQEELERALEMQASLRGSAIVMTATLTEGLRSALVRAFRAGLGRTDEAHIGRHYPALTVASGDSDACGSQLVESAPSQVRTVPVERLGSSAEAVEVLVVAATGGACCAWIRNTVDAVIEAAAALRERGVDVEIFHARFAMRDRLRIERRIVEAFGKRGGTDARRGRVLVASQVAEASLDLDFDVMVSDIAPIDSLIQRIGRLWRHTDLDPPRERHGERLVLRVVSPDPDDVDAATWSRGERGGDAAVYGAPLLWRTARALFDVGRIETPDGLPVLLEKVIGGEAPEVPESLEPLEDRAFGERSAHVALARANLVHVAKGYEEASGLTDDERFPTRVGEPSVRLVLVTRADDGGVRFWASGDDDGSASEVSVSMRRFERIEKTLPPRATEMDALTSDWPDWRKRDCPVLLVEPDGAIAEGLRYDSTSGLLFGP